MADSDSIETISTTALSPVDLWFALHYGLGVSPALLRLAVDETRLISALRDGALDELIVGQDSILPWDKSAAEMTAMLWISGTRDPGAYLLPKIQQATITALNKFLRLAATPEQRIALAEKYAFAYDDLTSWVVRADLLRLRAVDLETAEVLALAVWGVHDLASYGGRMPLYGGSDRQQQPEQRVGELQDKLDARINALTDSASRKSLRAAMGRLDLLNLWQIVEIASDHARRHPAQVVTATEAIVIVKGAGSQIQDETLDGFLRGFWPAIKAVDPQASLTQRRHVLASGDASASEDEDFFCAEVATGERRIWIKESYWEDQLRPPSATLALRLEWRMATYAFGSGLYELFAASQLSQRRNSWWNYFWAFFVQYCTIFTFLSFTLWDGGIVLALLARLGRSLAPGLYGAFSAWLAPLAALGIAAAALGIAVLAVVFSIRRAWMTYDIKRKAEHQRPLEQLPTLSGLLIWIAALTFLNSPLRYLQGLVVLILFQVVIVFAREVAWPWREDFNSDVDFSTPQAYRNEHGSCRFERVDRKLLRFLFSPALYRFTVVIGLPVTFFMLIVASLLDLIPGIDQAVSKVKALLSGTISGFLGDVATYATDPAQAARIRGVVEGDIIFLHQRPDVHQLHVFAHSQGTSITFESLFHYLPDRYRRKIKTYLTIGSILSYYHQTNPVLDHWYIPRFPRRPYPQFAAGFSWINFWNFNDPITEFCGLDEYQMYAVSSPAQGTCTVTLEPASPVNIRTDGAWFPLSSHSEYWLNLEQIHLPLVSRVLSDDHPWQWQRLERANWGARRARPRRWLAWLVRSYPAFVGLNWAVAAALLLLVIWALRRLSDSIWRWGTTSPAVDALYGWLTSELVVPIINLKLSFAQAITPIVDNPWIMHDLIWLALLILLLALLLWAKATIACVVRCLLLRQP